MGKFLDYLLNNKGIPYAKGQQILNKMHRLNPVNPIEANSVLEDFLRYSECLELLKQYIIAEEATAAPRKIRISKEEFETFFHIIDAKGRGRKPSDIRDNGED